MKSDKETAYIIDCKRTAIGSPHKSLKHCSAAQLASGVIRNIVERHSLKPSLLSSIVIGNTVSAGTGQNLARQASHLAGIPFEVPAFVINNVCGSGVQSLIWGTQALLNEEQPFMITGATESASQTPQLLSSNFDVPTDSLLFDGLKCSLSGKLMGEICEDLAQEEKISRKAQDMYTLVSHQKACLARRDKKFKNEIVPVAVSGGPVYDHDERPRETTSLEKLSLLPAAFRTGGTVTAGNSSAPSDGACAFLLSLKKSMEEHRLSPMARVVGYASIAVNPARVFSEGVSAIPLCLNKAGLSLKDIDLFEITEAFAAQAVYTQKKIGIPSERMNIHGGDVALGHPLGTSGARSLVTLIHALKSTKKRMGLAYVAFGGGGAMALVVESLS